MPEEIKPFQLDPAQFKIGNMLVDGVIKNIVKDVNRADWNKNGVPDISEYAPVVLKLIPLLVALNAVVDFEAVAKQLADNLAIKDRAAFRAILIEFGKLAEKVGTLLPH